MPVTATLSRKFYEKFGDDLTNELVNWLNQVDATYRSDLRELNESNFARFDAKLEQRAAELRAEMRGMEARLTTALQAVKADLLTSLHDTKAELLKWMFGTIFAAWATLLGAIALIKLH